MPSQGLRRHLWCPTLLSLWTAASTVTASANITATGLTLQTWWHDSGEVNYETPVQEGNVRQSHLYSTWVQSTTDLLET